MATPLVLDAPSITNWDDMEKIYHHMFYNELRIAPEENPVVLTENPRAPKNQREKCTQIFFETFSVPAFYLGIGGVFALFATGRTTGTCIDMGNGQSWVIPTVEGAVLNENVNVSYVGGRDITERLINLLTSGKGYSFTTTAEREMINLVKEELCYVALNASKETSKGAAVEKAYELPDGTVINLDQERYQAPEMIFQGAESLGEKAVASILRCGAHSRELAKNVVLCGGNSMFPGLPLRMRKELQGRLTEHDLSCQVTAPPHRNNLAWVGGSIMASHSTFQNRWITKEDYDEHGPAIIHLKSPN